MAICFDYTVSMVLRQQKNKILCTCAHGLIVQIVNLDWKIAFEKNIYFSRQSDR